MSGNPPAGYYADPSIPGYIRYWDGTEWVAGTSRPAPDEVADQVLASSQGTGSQGTGSYGTGSQGTDSPGADGAAQQDAFASSGPGASGPGASMAASVAQPAAQAWTPEVAADPQAAARAQAEAQAQALLVQSQAAQRAAAAQSAAGQAQAQVQAQQYASSPQQFQPSPQQYASSPQQYASNPQQFQPNPQQYASNPAMAPQVPQVPQQYASRPQIPAQVPAVPEPAHPAPATVAAMVVPSAFAARNATGTYAYGAPANPFAGLPDAASPGESEDDSPATVLELATPGSRVLARIIDLGIAAIFSAPVTVTLLLIAHRHDHQYVLGLEAKATTTYTTLGMDATGIALWAGAALALIVVAIVYEGYRLGRGGQTVGKKLAGVRVVHLPDANGLRGSGVGMRRALLLWVLAILPLIDLLTLGGVLWGRPYRQGLHERLTSTATVKA